MEPAQCDWDCRSDVSECGSVMQLYCPPNLEVGLHKITVQPSPMWTHTLLFHVCTLCWPNICKGVTVNISIIFTKVKKHGFSLF